MNQPPSIFDIPIKFNPWIPKDKVVVTDKFDNIIAVLDLETPRTKFMRLLNMGPGEYE